jgi:hypothetical protein
VELAFQKGSGSSTPLFVRGEIAMKKIITFFVLIICNMICINCIAEEMDKFTWKKEYIIDGNIISVDIPIYILDENELEVYDCTSYTEYIKNPNSDDKNNVYSYNENLRELTKEKDGTSEADIEVYDKGTELRVMLNNPEDLLGKNKNDNIKIKEYGFYQYQVDDKVTYAENNEMSLEEAEKYLEEIVEYFIKDEYNGIDIDYIKIAGRGRKTKSYTDEELGEYVDYYPKGSYFFNYYQVIHKIPIMMTIIATLNNKQENKIYGDLFEYWGTTGGICQIMDRNAFWLTVKWMKVEKVHNEKVKLLPIENVISALEKEIEDGHIRNVYSLKLGYIIYLNEESPKTYTLYPMWVLDCDYVETKGGNIKVNPYSQDIRDGFSFERICINAETAEIVDFLNPKTSMLYAP